MAKVKTPFEGVKDGEVYPTSFKEGDEVTGDLERVAIEEGWTESEVGDPEPEKKARKNAPENK